MKLSNFPYGKITAPLRQAVKWLRANKMKIGKEQFDYFDYPDYWDMPRKISSRLGGDEVDWLQEETYEWWHSHSRCNCKTVEKVITQTIKLKTCQLKEVSSE